MGAVAPVSRDHLAHEGRLLLTRHPAGRSTRMHRQRPWTHSQPRPHRCGRRAVLSVLRLRHSDPALAHGDCSPVSSASTRASSPTSTQLSYLDEDTLVAALAAATAWLRRPGAVDHLFAMKDWFIRGYDDYMPPPGRSRSPGSVINEHRLPVDRRARRRGRSSSSSTSGTHTSPTCHRRPSRSGSPTERPVASIPTSPRSSRVGRATRCSSRTSTTSSTPCPISTTSPTSTTPRSPTSTSRSAGSSTTSASSACSMTPWSSCSATTGRT